MGEDDAGAAEAGGIGDDLAHRQADRVMVTVVTAQMDAARGLIEVGDEQLLAAGPVIEAGREESARGVVAGKDRGIFGTLNLHRAKLGVAHYAS